MRYHGQRLVPVLMTLSLLFLVVMPAWAADPEIDRLLQSPVGKDWVTNGGNLTNQRYSTLKQIDTSNVKQLKGAWMTRLKGSGFGGKTGKEVWRTPIEVWQDGYGITSAPLYYDGIVYSGITGGEYGVRGRLTALDAKTGKILWRW